MAEEKKEKKYLAFYFNPNIEQPFKITEKNGVKSKNINDVSNIVFPNKVLIKVVNDDFVDPYMFDKQDYIGLATGKYVVYDEVNQVYTSRIYGYVVMRGRKVQVEPLIELTPDKMRASMYYIPSKEGVYPTVENIRLTLIEVNLKGYLGDSAISMQIEDLKKNNKKIGILTVCKGVPPVHGQIEHFVLLKEAGQKIGKELEDGRIDFKEKDTFTPINKGDYVLEKKEMIPPKDGYDVVGNVIKGEYKGEKLYIPGRNLEESKDKKNYYVATISGVLTISDRKVSVDNKIVIKKDIDLVTGNIKVEGSVEIFGSVRTGFEVKAADNIIIHGNVEDAVITAGGDIIIDNGVLGKERAYIEAGNNIFVRFAQNARFKAGGSLTVKESLIQCFAFAKNIILVEGTVVGGELIGKKGITVKVAGSDKGVETKLIAGTDPDIEALIKVKEEEKKHFESVYNEHLEDMKMQFGNQFLVDLKGFLNILRGSRKVKFIEMLAKLKTCLADVGKVKEEIQKLREQINFSILPVIQVQERVFSDVIIQIRRCQPRKIQKAKLGTIFKEDPETGIIIEQ